MKKEPIRCILNDLRELAVQNGEGTFGDLETAQKEIDSIINSPQITKEHKGIKNLIAPTGNLQDLAIECGWGKRFLVLAEKLEIELQKCT